MPETQPAPAAAPTGAARLTHPDRLYWPDAGITKGGLADYYRAVWPLAAPHVAGRPLALVRCPEGVTADRFFQKHPWKGARRAVLQVKDPKDPDGAPLIAIDSLDGLMGLVQAAAIEIHPWGSTLASWEAPDRIVMDLDPGAGTPWSQVVAAAKETAVRLRDAGLAPFVKTSGGNGLHVVAPVTPKARWREAKAFTKAIAEAMAADSPDLYVATITKAKRGGKVLIDYLRNQRGATAVAPYSARAWPGAPVSMPIRWAELEEIAGSGFVTVGGAPAHLAARKDDPWAGFAEAAVPLAPLKPSGR